MRQQAIDRLATLARRSRQRAAVMRPVLETLVRLNPAKGLTAQELTNLQHMAQTALISVDRPD